MKEGFDDVIGRAADLAPDLEPMPKLAKQPVMPVASLEELKEPSPKPFTGRPDIEFPELDSLEPLYLPKFLLRRWGPTKFFSSAYFASWKSEAQRSSRLHGTDLKPSEQKKKR